MVIVAGLCLSKVSYGRLGPINGLFVIVALGLLTRKEKVDKYHSIRLEDRNLM